MSRSKGRICPDSYEEALCLFCRQSAIFDHFKRCREAGIKISGRELDRAMEQTKVAKEELMIEKQNLGYDDGFDFLAKPAYFDGFTLKDQRLDGNFQKLVPICEGMRNVERVTKKNNFKYEQATLILSHYYMQKGCYPMKGAWKFALRNLFLKVLVKTGKEKAGETGR